MALAGLRSALTWLTGLFGFVALVLLAGLLVLLPGLLSGFVLMTILLVLLIHDLSMRLRLRTKLPQFKLVPVGVRIEVDMHRRQTGEGDRVSYIPVSQ